MKKKPKQVKEQDRATIGHGKATSISPHQTWCQRLGFAKEISYLIKGQDPKLRHEVKEFTHTFPLHSLLEGFFSLIRPMIKTIKDHCDQECVTPAVNIGCSKIV